MIQEYKTNINVRILFKQKEQIKKLVESGKFESLSQVVHEALNEFLSKHYRAAKP